MSYPGVTVSRFEEVIYQILWRAEWIERVADAADCLSLSLAYEHCAAQMWRCRDARTHRHFVWYPRGSAPGRSSMKALSLRQPHVAAIRVTALEAM